MVVIPHPCSPKWKIRRNLKEFSSKTVFTGFHHYPSGINRERTETSLLGWKAFGNGRTSEQSQPVSTWFLAGYLQWSNVAHWKMLQPLGKKSRSFDLSYINPLQCLGSFCRPQILKSLSPAEDLTGFLHLLDIGLEKLAAIETLF